MRKPTFILLLAACLTNILSISTAAGEDDVVLLNQIANYRQWTRVTPAPIKVEASVTAIDTIKIDPASIVS
jgi:hypothetical protein